MYTERSTILVVEDDRATRTFLADNLTADGYVLDTAVDAREAMHKLRHGFPDLVVLDLGLPDRDGLELLREIREADGVASRIDPALPLLVLSGRADELHRIRALDRGADEVVQKPYSYPELAARIAALLRRAEQRSRTGRLRIGALEFDPAARMVRVNGRVVRLSQKEFALLRTLAPNPTKVHTKSELLRHIWGYRDLGSTRTLDSHACRLRQKLSRDGEAFVVNVWGIGYRLCDGPVES